MQRILLQALVAVVALLQAASTVAWADDPPPADQRTDDAPISAPLSELRASDLRISSESLRGPEIAPASDGRELLIFVGGYGSTANDGAFDRLKERFPPESFDVVRLGEDPRFPYDTYGDVDTNATVLIQQIRELSPRYAGVHLVTHSMGGVVADRAIAKGLSSEDGVRTYVAIAAPHSGADFARVPAAVLPRIGPVKDIVRLPAVLLARDPESEAISDLASARPVAASRGITRVDVTLATDGLVSRGDAHNPAVPQRVFLPRNPSEALNGHGGSLTNEDVAKVVVETVRTRQVPADGRDAVSKAIAPLVWDQQAVLWRTALVLAAVGAICLYIARFTPYCQPFMDRASALCRRILHMLGR